MASKSVKDPEVRHPNAVRSPARKGFCCQTWIPKPRERGIEGSENLKRHSK
jgi:hypothetical protein